MARGGGCLQRGCGAAAQQPDPSTTRVGSAQRPNQSISPFDALVVRFVASVYMVALTEIGRLEIEAALKEFDQVGREAFLQNYGFGTASTYLLKLGGRLYDPKAIADGFTLYRSSRTGRRPMHYSATG